MDRGIHEFRFNPEVGAFPTVLSQVARLGAVFESRRSLMFVHLL